MTTPGVPAAVFALKPNGRTSLISSAKTVEITPRPHGLDDRPHAHLHRTGTGSSWQSTGERHARRPAETIWRRYGTESRIPKPVRRVCERRRQAYAYRLETPIRYGAEDFGPTSDGTRAPIMVLPARTGRPGRNPQMEGLN